MIVYLQDQKNSVALSRFSALISRHFGPDAVAGIRETLSKIPPVELATVVVTQD
jgi:hypothetical protein